VWRCRSVGSSSSLLHSLGPEPAAGQFLEGDQSRGGGGGGGASERARSKKAGEMAGGGMAALGVNTERAAQYKGRMTLAVAMTCLVAAVGGAIFGYDIGISGTSVLPAVPSLLESSSSLRSASVSLSCRRNRELNNSQPCAATAGPPPAPARQSF
jgi:hypothetical protein